MKYYMILQQNNYNYWQFLGNVMHELGEPLHAVGGFVYLLRHDDQLPELLDDERSDLLQRSDDCLERVQQAVSIVLNLSYYAMKQEMELKDQVHVNSFCRELVKEQACEVRFGSDVADDLAITTNEQCLSMVIGLLVKQAVARVCRTDAPMREPLVSLVVTQRGERGKLTFSVTDNGRREAVGDLQQLFFLPAEKEAAHTLERTEFLLCCRLVELLDGFLYIEPEFKDGRRVVFQVAL